MATKRLFIGCVVLMALTGAETALWGQTVVGFVYVANEFDGNVTAYSIDGTTGALMPVVRSPFPSGAGSDSVAVDPTGHFAYVANCGSACVGISGPRTVSAYSINAVTGELGPLGSVPGGSGPVSLTVEPTGTLLYVANCGSSCSSQQTGPDTVSAYLIGADGSLTPMADFPAGLGPVSVAVDPTAPFVYVANLGSENVSAYKIETDGSLSPLTPIRDFPAGPAPSSVAVDPTGSFAYVTSAGIDAVSAYKIETDGSLSPLMPMRDFPAGSNPRSVTVDPTGSFAYVANCGGGLCFGPGSVSAYKIETDGSLTPVPGSPFPAGSGPVSVAVDLTGHFAYVANKFSNDVWAYAIGIDGSLTPIDAFPAGSVPASVTTTAVP